MDPAHYGVPEMTSVKVETDDGLRLTAWYRPPANEDTLTLLYLHGNAGHIGYRADKVKPYLEAGYGMLLLSYRGYGTNPGYPTEDHLYLDSRAALKFLADQHIPIFKTVIYGESLGTGVAVEVAQNLGIAGLVLEAPFSSMVDAAALHFKLFPTSLLVRDKYDSLSKINNIKAPILIIHGKNDRTIPYSLGRKLYDMAPQPKEFFGIPNAGHNDLYDHGVAAKIIEYLENNL
ncbi:MAG: alpha/beta hydrolase [Rhodospirillaceae bacterium]|nr:alpha/beta hydrolase [Rhodospirillaceae bacterium]